MGALRAAEKGRLLGASASGARGGRSWSMGGGGGAWAGSVRLARLAAGSCPGSSSGGWGGAGAEVAGMGGLGGAGGGEGGDSSEGRALLAARASARCWSAVAAFGSCLEALPGSWVPGETSTALRRICTHTCPCAASVSMVICRSGCCTWQFISACICQQATSQTQAIMFSQGMGPLAL